MTVFTIFCHGTGESREENEHNEIIHDLSEIHDGYEGGDYLILDGPGAGKIKPGTFNPLTKMPYTSDESYARPTSETIDLFEWKRRHLYNQIEEKKDFSAPQWNGKMGAIANTTSFLPHKITGNLFGLGMDNNIQHAITILASIFTNGLNGVTINMIGWSRGAVTCFRLANWIEEFLGGGADINIFAIDPVAGGSLGEHMADTWIIPSSVKKLLVIIVQDDKRSSFQPQDLSRLQFKSSQTEYAFLPMPGSHDTPVRATKDPVNNEVALITRHLAYNFLLQNGTIFETSNAPNQPPYTLTTNQMTERYANIKIKRDIYDKKGKSNITKIITGLGLKSRAINSDIDKYISHNASFFVNEHHVACFKKSQISIYNSFFQNSSAPPPIATPGRRNAIFSSASSQSNLQQFRNSNPKSMELLIKLEVVANPTSPGGNLANFIPTGNSLSQPDNGANSTGRHMLNMLS